MTHLITREESAAERLNELVKVSQAPAACRSGHRRPGGLTQSPLPHHHTPAVSQSLPGKHSSRWAGTLHFPYATSEMGRQANRSDAVLGKGGPGTYPACHVHAYALSLQAHSSASAALSQSTGPGWGSRLQAGRLCRHGRGQEVGTGAEEPGAQFGLRTFFFHSQTQFCAPFERKQRIAVLSPRRPASFNLPVAAICNYNFRGRL